MESKTYRQLVAGNVRAEMARRNISQTNMAKQLGYTQQALSRRLTSAVAFDVDELATIANVLDVTVTELLSP